MGKTDEPKRKGQMKQIYYFIRRPWSVSVDDVLYIVSVGSSLREQAKLELLRQYACDGNAWLVLRSEAADVAVWRLSERLFPNSVMPVTFLRKKTISVAEAYRRVIDDDWADIEADFSESRAWFHQLNAIGKAIPVKRMRPQGAPSLHRVRRKNLRDVLSELPSSVIFSFATLVILFLFMGWFEGHYMY